MNGGLGVVKHVFAPAIQGQCPPGPGVYRAQPGAHPANARRHAHVWPVGALDSPAASSPALSASNAPNSCNDDSDSRVKAQSTLSGLDLRSVLCRSNGTAKGSSNSSGTGISSERMNTYSGEAREDFIDRKGDNEYSYADTAPNSAERSTATDVAEVSFELDDHGDGSAALELGLSREKTKNEDEDRKRNEEETTVMIECASDSDSDASQWGDEEEVVVFSLDNRQGSRQVRKRFKDSLNASATMPPLHLLRRIWGQVQDSSKCRRTTCWTHAQVRTMTTTRLARSGKMCCL